MASSIKRQSTASIGTIATAIGSYTAPSVATGVLVSGLVVANILPAASVLVNVYIQNGANQFNLLKNGVVMAGGSVTICDEGNRQALNSSDQVFVVSNTANSVDVNMSVTEIS